MSPYKFPFYIRSPPCINNSVKGALLAKTTGGKKVNRGLLFTCRFRNSLGLINRATLSQYYMLKHHFGTKPNFICNFLLLCFLQVFYWNINNCLPVISGNIRKMRENMF